MFTQTAVRKENFSLQNRKASKMRKNIWTLFLCGLLVVALVIGVAFAQNVKIKAKKGGVVKLKQGVELVIPPKSLKKDTKIKAHIMTRQIGDKKKGSKRNQLVFDFGPSGTKFDAKRPAELHINEKFLKKEKIDDIVICEGVSGDYGFDYRETRGKLIIYIPHFSHYYFARR